MRRANDLVRHACRLVTSIAVGGACMLSHPMAALAGPDAAPSASAPSAAPARGGQWIHVDPQTGQRTAPAAPRAAIPPDPAFSTSHQGLREEPAPGGGVMVNLQGRFRSAATATIGPDGAVVRDCVAPGTAAGGHEP